MTTRATEIVFLPGFDGDGSLREPFIAALAEKKPARALTYPNRAMGSLNGYARFAAAEIGADSRPVVIAESFGGLIAARWAANDAHVAGVVLCGAFARSPVALAALGARLPSISQFLGAHFLNPIGFVPADPARRRWSQGLSNAVATLDRDVIAERLRLIAEEDVGHDLASVRTPVVVAEFTQDLVVNRASTAHLASCCASPLRIHLEGPHFAIETRPRESAEALLPYVEAIFDKVVIA